MTPWLHRTLALFCLITLGGLGALGAQNLRDDIVNNDLASAKSKVALLSPDFKGFAYLAHYISQTGRIQLETVDWLLTSGADPDQVDEDGFGPLFHAIRRGHRDLVQRLIAAKANVNAEWKRAPGGSMQIWDEIRALDRIDLYNQETGEAYPYFDVTDLVVTPTYLALGSENTEILDTLLQAGADPLLPLLTATVYTHWDKDDPKNKKTTIFATAFTQVVKIFQENQTDFGLVSPWVFANSARLLQSVSQLPENRRPVIPALLTENILAYLAMGNTKAFISELAKTSEGSMRFLPYALLVGNAEILDLILQYNNMGIDDVMDDQGNNLMSYALTGLHSRAVALLMDLGAMIPDTVRVAQNFSYRNINTLNYVVRSGKVDLVSLLLKAGADPKKTLALIDAHPWPEVRALLAQGGAPTGVFFQQESGSPLYQLIWDAASKGESDAVAWYATKENLPQGNGDKVLNPLIIAVKNRHVETVRVLLELGINPDPVMTLIQVNWAGLSSNLQGTRLLPYAQTLAQQGSDLLARTRSNQIVRLLQNAQRTYQTDYPVGSTGPGGGLIIYDKGWTSDGWRWLEVVKAPIGSFGFAVFRGTLEFPLTSKALGAGKENSNTLAAFLRRSPNLSLPALNAVRAYRGGEKDDWFLPSGEELSLASKVVKLEKPGWTSNRSNPVYMMIVLPSGNLNYSFSMSEPHLVFPMRAF